MICFSICSILFFGFPISLIAQLVLQFVFTLVFCSAFFSLLSGGFLELYLPACLWSASFLLPYFSRAFFVEYFSQLYALSCCIFYLLDSIRDRFVTIFLHSLFLPNCLFLFVFIFFYIRGFSHLSGNPWLSICNYILSKYIYAFTDIHN